VDRTLVSFLIAAALDERILRLDLSFADAVFVPLAAPQEEGVTGTLRRTAYSALELSPGLQDQVGAARALLMRNALSAHPDDRLLWDRPGPNDRSDRRGHRRQKHVRASHRAPPSRLPV